MQTPVRLSIDLVKGTAWFADYSLTYDAATAGNAGSGNSGGAGVVSAGSKAGSGGGGGGFFG